MGYPAISSRQRQPPSAVHSPRGGCPWDGGSARRPFRIPNLPPGPVLCQTGSSVCLALFCDAIALRSKISVLGMTSHTSCRATDPSHGRGRPHSAVAVALGGTLQAGRSRSGPLRCGRVVRRCGRVARPDHTDRPKVSKAGNTAGGRWTRSAGRATTCAASGPSGLPAALRHASCRQIPRSRRGGAGPALRAFHKPGGHCTRGRSQVSKKLMRNPGPGRRSPFARCVCGSEAALYRGRW